MDESTVLPLQVLGQKSRSEILVERICSHLQGSFFELPLKRRFDGRPRPP